MGQSCWTSRTCISFPKVVTGSFLVNAEAAKLQHMAALNVAAVAAGSLFHQLKLLFQGFLQQVGVITACNSIDL